MSVPARRDDDAPRPWERDRRPPWERQKGETARAFRYFVTYRDAGATRSHGYVASEHGITRGRIEQLSRQWRWVERVELWEDELDRRRREDLDRRRQEALDRHMGIGAGMVGVGMRALFGDRDGQLEGIDPATLNGDPNALARWLETAIRIERLAHGEPTDLVRGSLLVSSAKVTDVARGIVEIALRMLPEEAHAAFIREVEAFGRSLG